MERRLPATLDGRPGAMGEIADGVCRWWGEASGEALVALVQGSFGRELLLVAASGRWWARVERLRVAPDRGLLEVTLLLREAPDR